MDITPEQRAAALRVQEATHALNRALHDAAKAGLDTDLHILDLTATASRVPRWHLTVNVFLRLSGKTSDLEPSRSRALPSGNRYDG